MTRTIDAKSLEDAIVRNAAPTLAGIKPACLFTFPGAFFGGVDSASARSAFVAALELCEQQMAWAGVHARVLVWRGCGALVLVYRAAALMEWLANPRASVPLAREGYPVGNLDGCLVHLANRIAARGKVAVSACAPDLSAYEERSCKAGRCSMRFPHEIGFFLGYPYADVEAFITHEGRDYLIFGAWKVYFDVPGA